MRNFEYHGYFKNKVNINRNFDNYSYKSRMHFILIDIH